MEPVSGESVSEPSLASNLSRPSSAAPRSSPSQSRSSRRRNGRRGLTAVYLARHGQTESNLLHRYAGYAPESITECGRAQMRALAAAIGSCGIGEIWTSEVVRSRESAEVVGSVLNVPVGVEPRFNELRMGPWEGLTEAQVAERYPEAFALWCALPDRLTLEGRETLAALAERVTAAVRDAASRPHPVLVMSHVAPIRVAVLSSLQVPLCYYKQVRVTNGDCVVVESDRSEAHRLGEEVSLRQEIPVADPESSLA